MVLQWENGGGGPCPRSLLQQPAELLRLSPGLRRELVRGSPRRPSRFLAVVRAAPCSEVLYTLGAVKLRASAAWGTCGSGSVGGGVLGSHWVLGLLGRVHPLLSPTTPRTAWPFSWPWSPCPAGLLLTTEPSALLGGPREVPPPVASLSLGTRAHPCGVWSSWCPREPVPRGGISGG